MNRIRVLIVGADGADPRIVARLMSESKLPNLARLCAQGAWGALQTTFPPVSPVAWTTCLTGVPPAVHGVRDFITKSPGSYLPTIGLFQVSTGPDRIPVYSSGRVAPTMAELLSSAGKTAYILQVPGTFPPSAIRGGMLAGFGMPDLLGTFGVSAWYTTDVAGKSASAPEGAELVRPLVPLGGGTWQGRLDGPAGTTQGFTIRREGSGVTLYLEASGGRAAAMLGMGEWSGWIAMTFAVPGRRSVSGMCRFRLVSLGHDVELYRTAIQCVPEDPLFALAEPPGFAVRLQNMVGPYATLGMPSDLDGVRRGVVDPETFVQDAYANWEKQVDIALSLIEPARGGEPDWDLLMAHFFTIDNIQHLFWHGQDSQHPAHTPQAAARFGGEIERAYRWFDAQLGRMLDRLPPDTTVLVVSDHGGAPIYRLAYLNAWLESGGYLVPREQAPEGTAARLDWDRTRAAMFGTGAIWLNVQGRDPRGIVPSGASYQALRQEIAQGLLGWRDPETGQRVVKRVFLGEDVFGPQRADGAAAGSVPDLVVALHPGYGLGRGEGLGRVMSGQSTTVPNLSAWTGGHEGPYLPSDIPGIYVFSDQRRTPVQITNPGLQDVAPTVMHVLGVERPSGMAGRWMI
jgi:predicted AlkP superfamily phosphohydrolase/phosphomutase